MRAQVDELAGLQYHAVGLAVAGKVQRRNHTLEHGFGRIGTGWVNGLTSGVRGLTGVVTGTAARERLAQRFDTFVMPGKGIRCVGDRPWVTAAETCECAMAHLAVGERSIALELFMWAQQLRHPDGRYYTGVVYPELVHFPDDELSTYTAAAVVLAADALVSATPAAHLFTAHQPLPPITLAEDDLDLEDSRD